MTSGIEVRDGGLPRRPGARRQGHGGRKVIIAPDGGDAWVPARPRPDETLIRALARAHRWKRMLREGRYRSAAEIAEAEGLTRSFVNRLLRLTLLAPRHRRSHSRRTTAKGDAAGRLGTGVLSSWDEQKLSCTGFCGHDIVETGTARSSVMDEEIARMDVASGAVGSEGERRSSTLSTAHDARNLAAGERGGRWRSSSGSRRCRRR